jgi:hypothetical protein
VSQPERRIFVYKPPVPVAPEPEREPPEETDILRAWLLTPLGAMVIWMFAFGLTLPAVALVIFTLPENYARFVLGGGLWVMLGLVVIHWWLPPGDPETPHAEGLAIAGWHVFATLMGTAFFAWLMLFSGGRPAFVLSDVYPVMFISSILLVMFGIVLTLVRGHLPGRALRYAWTLLCFLATWASLWPVAAQWMM